MLISEDYRKLNAQMHAEKPYYGASHMDWSKAVKAFVNQQPEVKTILDYGCGKGVLKQRLIALGMDERNIAEYDPAIEGKDSRTEAHLVTCFDVLEHIEPDCLDDVLQDIANHTLRYAILSPSTVPAMKHLSDGRNAHLIVQDAAWWKKEIEQYFEIASQSSNNAPLYFVCKPRKKNK